MKHSPRLRTSLYVLLAFILPAIITAIALHRGTPKVSAAKSPASSGATIYLPFIAHQVPPVPVRRVNAPYFNGTIWYGGAAIFWFGRIYPTGIGSDSENYADVRVGYNATELLLRVTVFDRRIWCNTNPAGSDMTLWDTVSVSLDRNGNTGGAPSTNAVRLVSEFWGSGGACAGNLQGSYVGNGTGWVPSNVSFTTESLYRGFGGPNLDADNQGWVQTFHIPFSSLGLSGPPASGTVWGLALNLYDRDDAAGNPIPVKRWPESMDSNRPSTWGQLSFGLPPAYVPPPPKSPSTTSIKNGVNGAIVPDGMVGGSMVCGQGLDLWTQWGQANYAGQQQVNIQNQDDVADWPCFAKYYITFPLDSLPSSKVILSSTVTLFQFGNAGMGWTPGPFPSLIQVFSVSDNWNEGTLNWNDAPLALEYISSASVDPLATTAPWPGIPRTWDVSAAVAKAYAAGLPLRLVFYSADKPMHSGKYFYSSYAGPEGRPTLQVRWGDP